MSTNYHLTQIRDTEIGPALNRNFDGYWILFKWMRWVIEFGRPLSSQLLNFIIHFSYWSIRIRIFCQLQYGILGKWKKHALTRSGRRRETFHAILLACFPFNVHRCFSYLLRFHADRERMSERVRKRNFIAGIENVKSHIIEMKRIRTN